jgi:hypothetical protein
VKLQSERNHQNTLACAAHAPGSTNPFHPSTDILGDFDVRIFIHDLAPKNHATATQKNNNNIRQGSQKSISPSGSILVANKKLKKFDLEKIASKVSNEARISTLMTHT